MCGICLILSSVHGDSSLPAGSQHDAFSTAATAALARRGPSQQACKRLNIGCSHALSVCASVLHMRGSACTTQPVPIVAPCIHNAHTAHESLFCWNGEVFGCADGPAPGPDASDTDFIASSIAAACAARGDTSAALAHILSRIEGPWACTLALIHCSHAPPCEPELQLFFARDPFGRRSLLSMRCTPGLLQPARFIVSSIAVGQIEPLVAVEVDEDELELPAADGVAAAYLRAQRTDVYEEVAPLGVYCVHVSPVCPEGEVVWSDSNLKSSCTLRRWPPDTPHSRFLLQRPPAPPNACAVAAVTRPTLAEASFELLKRLSVSVRTRVQSLTRSSHRIVDSSVPASLYMYPADGTPHVLAALKSVSSAGHSETALPSNARHAVAVSSSRESSCNHSTSASIAVLFSGGLDSMVIAALAHVHTPQGETIDLINVCFARGHASPDRVAAVAGLRELRALHPTRSWQLICVDSSLEEAMQLRRHLSATLHPAASHMDFNIGAALWFAAQGVGFVDVVTVDGCVQLGEPQMGRGMVSTTPAVRYADGSSHGRDALDDIVDAAPMGGMDDALAEPCLEYELPAHLQVHAQRWCDETRAMEGLPSADAIPAATVPAEPAVCEPSVRETAAPSARGCVGVAVLGEHAPPCCTRKHSRRCIRHMCAPCCHAAQRLLCDDVRTCACHRGAAATSTPPAAAAAASTGDATHVRVLVRSRATVLLVGLGADEQMAGYSRHRTRFAFGAWQRLESELRADCDRIWLRNFGRDDRVCSDHGREMRLPFFDERVVLFLRQLPLPFITDPTQPPGIGDKRILRVAARMLGLRGAARLVKRAIHFGSRIAKASNVTLFGSNRAGRGDAAALYLAPPAVPEDDGLEA